MYLLNTCHCVRLTCKNKRQLTYLLTYFLSVPWSHHSTAAAAYSGFAAERSAGRKYQSTAAGAQQQLRCSTALSSKSGQCHCDNQTVICQLFVTSPNVDQFKKLFHQKTE